MSASDSRPLVVLAGHTHPDGLAQLEKEARVVITNEETEEGFLRVAADAHGVLLRSKPLCTAHLMSSLKNLKVVGRHGVGLDIVDLPAATRLGIPVVHSPGSNSQAVAEHALMMMLACVKRAKQIDRMTRAGDWSARSGGNTELGGKTLGIVGIGNIGRRVAKFTAALGMRVLAYDKYVPADEIRARGAEPVASLEALLPQIDVLTCHTPLTAETRGMINARTLGLMKKGAIYVNTSRGGVQNERALFEALTRGHLAAAGIDVWEEEPCPVDNPLLNLDNVVASTHIAGVTQEATRVNSLQVTSEMLRVLRGEKPHVLGNPELWPRLLHLK